MRHALMIKFGGIWSTLKSWTLNLTPLMVYSMVLSSPTLSSNETRRKRGDLEGGAIGFRV